MTPSTNKRLTMFLVCIMAFAGIVFGSGPVAPTFRDADRSADNVYQTEFFELGDGVDPAVPGIADVRGSLLQAGPDWADLFAADRSPKDEFDRSGNAGSNGVPDFLESWGDNPGRRDVAFIADDVFVAGGSDGSVFVETGVVGSGTVEAGYDLGNAYAYTGFANLWNLTLYAGVERLSSAGGTIVFEFNRQLFSIASSGAILGERSISDLQIQASFSAGILDSLVLQKWDVVDAQTGAEDWVILETLPINPEDPPEQCNATKTVCALCNGVSIDSGAWPSYDAEGDQIAALLPATFMEFGINLSELVGHNWQNFYNTRYTTIQITSYDDEATPMPRDYALGTFTRAARLSPAGEGR